MLSSTKMLEQLETYHRLSDDDRSPYPDAWNTPGVVSQIPLFSTTRSVPGVREGDIAAEVRVLAGFTATVSCRNWLSPRTPPMTPLTIGIWPACTSRLRPTTTQRAASRVNIADRGIRWSRREKGFLQAAMLYIIGPLLLREQFSIRHHSLEEVQCNELVPNSTPTCYVDPVDAASGRDSTR